MLHRRVRQLLLLRSHDAVSCRYQSNIVPNCLPVIAGRLEETPTIVRDETAPEIANNHVDPLDPEPAFSDDDEFHGNNDDEDDIPLGWVEFVFF